MANEDELREGSIASRVFDARRVPETEARRADRRLADPPTPAPESPTARVMDRSRPRLVGVAAALVCAAILHAGLLVVAAYSLESPSKPDQKRESREAMQIRHVVQTTPPPAPEPTDPSEPPEQSEPPPQEAPPAETTSDDPEPSPSDDSAATSESRREATESSLPNDDTESTKPAAKAGEVVAAESDSPQVADFTDFEVNSGNADSFAGGVTAPSGSSDRAVEDEDAAVGNGTGDEAEGAGKGARAVGLDRTDWDCPWPEQAKHLSVDEQVVVLRAVVGSDGIPRSVSLVSDPGFGFGQAALECARSHMFRPALDENGEPKVATSPLIRVRFTR